MRRIFITPFSTYLGRSHLILTAIAVTALVGCGGSESSSTITVPGAPTIGVATAGNGTASIAFTAPASNGGSAITGYTATCSVGGTVFTQTGGTSPLTVSGLTNGGTYSCTVSATNQYGTGSASSAVSVRPVASVPDAPTIGTATPGNASISVAFSAPANNGGASISLYTVTCSANGASTPRTGSTSPINIGGLTNGTTYTCSVTATNSAGESAASAAVQAQPSPSQTVPGAPTIGAVTAGDGSASVAFAAPSSNGGSEILTYTASCTTSTTQKTLTGGTSPLLVSGLTNGTTYSCTVLATNGVGPGAASAAVTVTPTAASSAITAKSSSLNTAVGTSTPTTATAVSGTGTSTSTAGVGCDAKGTGTTVTGVVNANNTSNITSPVSNSYTYSWTCSSTTRSLSANAIPNHAVGVFPNSGNPNTIGTQTVSATIKLSPTLASTATDVGVAGYGINGIKFDANTGGGCANSVTSVGACDLARLNTWSLEALTSVTPFDFGADTNFAHVQPTGDYHYHGAPKRLYEALGGTYDSAGVPNKMVLIGWAVDGFPMYYKVGYSTATSISSGLKVLKGNYLPNSSSTTASTRPSASVFPLGTFKNDWAYSASNGGDLDECNGRTGVTPEFPTGIYYYVVTDTYPFAPRCIKGST